MGETEAPWLLMLFVRTGWGTDGWRDDLCYLRADWFGARSFHGTIALTKMASMV